MNTPLPDGQWNPGPSDQKEHSPNIHHVDIFSPRMGRGNKEGSLVLDNRANGEGLRELPTRTCCHCGTIVLLNPKRVRPRSSCLKCFDYVCDHPICNKFCTPIKQSLEMANRGLLVNPFNIDERSKTLLADQQHGEKKY